MTGVAVNYRCQPGCKIVDTRADLVGVAGFEPTAPRSQSECATKLRHTPSTCAPRVAVGAVGSPRGAADRPGARA